jgi:succinate dehydrogenase/fumarate reductase flavoprotein subunit
MVDCDLLVVGSGAGGLSAAITAAWHGLDVVLAEREPVCGGATAWSGGWMWVPLNPLYRADGVVEDPEPPRTFLRHVLGKRYDEARVEAFLTAGPPMVSFFHERTSLQLVSGTTIPDIHGRLPGAGTGGRSVAPQPYDARRLPRPLREMLRWQLYETSLLGMGIMAGPTCRRSCTPPARPGPSRTPPGGSAGTPPTWPCTGAACSSSTAPRSWHGC